jgi:L-ascorbate metabolism protein UlaG (beta-lactamase superfamily)
VSTRITWLGHSTALIEVDGVGLLTDPMLRRRVAHLRRDAAVELGPLPKVDAVLVSHVHRDHLDLPSLARLGRSVRVYVPLGTGNTLRRRGFDNVTEVEAGDEFEIGAVTVRATHAEHPVKRGPLSAPTPAVGYVVKGSKTVYFAGDTDLFDEMAELAGADVALLPISGWGPRVPAGHLDPERAAQALTLLRPKVVVPIHWGTYSPMHLAPAGSGAERSFEEHAARLAPEVEVCTLEVGGSHEF